MSPLKKQQGSEGLVIRSSRLTLRPFRRTDLKSLRLLLGRLDNRTFFDSGGRPLTPASLAGKMIREAHAHKTGADLTRLSLAILPKGKRSLIGGALIECDTEGWANVGLWLSPDHRERGLGKEALSAIIRLAFEELGRTRISGVCSSDNRASLRLMESCGMHFQHGLTSEDAKGNLVKLFSYAINRTE